MPLPLHNILKDLKNFFLGANYNRDPELLGIPTDGQYVDALNMRPNSMTGKEGSLQKIKGEELKYSSIDNSCGNYYDSSFDDGDWYCMATSFIKNHIVELWCDKNGVLDPFIRVDGVIVAASPGLPISFLHPVQIDKNDTCLGGEIYITDYYSPPMILNIEDMMQKSGLFPGSICTKDYFDDFNPDDHNVNLTLPAHKMMFIECTPNAGYPADRIFGSGGLDLGQYAYSFRYVSTTGDRTAWCPTTPLIPVPVNINYIDDQYPGIKTFGGVSAGQSNLGIVLRFRIENTLSYSYVEFRRHAWNTGAAVGYVPIGEIIGTLPILPGEVSVRTIVDMGVQGEPITDEEDTTSFGTIDAAKGIRYFENKLVLMNIRYASRDISNSVTYLQKSGQEFFPVMQNMGKVGHDDPWFGTYKRSFMSGEKYGFAVGFYDNLLTKTFAIPPPLSSGFRNYQLPDRRDAASPDTITYSYDGVANAVVYSLNSAAPCHERFDLADAVEKTNYCDFVNIATDGSKGEGCDGDIGIDHEPVAGCNHIESSIDVADIGYRPMTPVGQNDAVVSGHNYNPTVRVYPTEDQGANDAVWFHPQGFAPNYYSGGMAMAGIDVDLLPTWVQAFTVLRTKPAGRIICQGMGFYKLNAGKASEFGTGARGTKIKNKFWFYSAEMASWSGVISQGIIDNIASNPGGRYKAQLVSPVGMFAEVPWGENRDITGRDIIDMCVYPRFYRDDVTINTEPDPTSTGSGHWVEFGKWRNDSYPAWVTSLATNKATFTINQLSTANNNGKDDQDSSADFIGDRGGEYMVLGVDSDIYLNESVGANGEKHYDKDGLKNWHEPMYYVNIVDSLADVPQNDVQEYFDTGSYIKIKSLIGISTGLSLTEYQLVDERWEDCRPYTANTYTDIASVDTNYINSLLYIEKTNGIKEVWLNADGVSDVDLAAMTLPFTIGGGALSKPNVTISGFFRTTVTQVNGKNRFYKIVFTVPSNVPTSGSKMFVKYDKEVPIQFFNGDTYIGDDIFAPVDRKIPNGGGNPRTDEPDQEKPFFMDNGFPYFVNEVNPRIIIVNNAFSNENKIQDCSSIRTIWIRQMVALFNCESHIHLPYYHEVTSVDPRDFIFNKYFPATNYIQRPINWRTNPLSDNFESAGNGHISQNYHDSYYNEEYIWRYGGYRFRPNYNIDYLHTNNIESWTSKPVTGYVERTEYCSRVIWSLERDISKQDVPGLRTFLPGNHYDIDDSTGPIKMAWSALGGNKGFNLYAITQRGVCLIPTGTEILRDGTAEQIATLKSTQGFFINNQYWISTNRGMPNEMWRSHAEYNNVLYWCDLNTAYRMEDNQIADIGREGRYHHKIYGSYLSKINGEYPSPAGTGSWLTGFYDIWHNEYVSEVEVASAEEESILINSLAYNANNKSWNGIYTTVYDQFLSISDNINLGMGSKYKKSSNSPAETYLLNTGYLIDGNPITSWSLQVHAPEQIKDKEMKGIRIASTTMPDTINFYDNIDQFESNSPVCIVQGTNMRNYNGYEQYIGRRLDNGNRYQGRMILAQVIHNRAEDFTIIDEMIYYQILGQTTGNAQG